jgi:4-hydroxy-3-methylbut-2-enyl diphosphate reductase
VHQVQTAADLRPEWFHGAGTVGITAGTSTPDAIVDGVEEWLRAWNSGAPARLQSIQAR